MIRHADHPQPPPPRGSRLYSARTHPGSTASAVHVAPAVSRPIVRRALFTFRFVLITLFILKAIEYTYILDRIIELKFKVFFIQ